LQIGKKRLTFFSVLAGSILVQRNMVRTESRKEKQTMKAIVMVLCVIFMSVAASAQTVENTKDQPEAVVVKFSWSKERLGWERDPFGGPIENFDEMRLRTRNEKRILDAKKGGNDAELNKAEREARADAALVANVRQKAPPRYGFLYKASVKNNSEKTIKAIDWDYVFFDTENQVELGRQQFRSEEKISRGKTKEMKVFILNPPTQTISVNALNKNERDGLGERVELMRIEYSDGSLWHRQ
jgi:hypothetical protein